MNIEDAIEYAKNTAYPDIHGIGELVRACNNKPSYWISSHVYWWLYDRVNIFPDYKQYRQGFWIGYLSALVGEKLNIQEIVLDENDTPKKISNKIKGINKQKESIENEISQLRCRIDKLDKELKKLSKKQEEYVFNPFIEKHEIKLNHEWELLNDQINDVYSHKIMIELMRQKSKMWESNVRTGFVLNDVGEWNFKEPTRFEPFEITTYDSYAREFTAIQTNNIPRSSEDPILGIQKPTNKINNQLLIGDIVHVRFTNGEFTKARVIDIKVPQTIEYDDYSIEYPAVVISKSIRTGSDYRGYIVDYEYCSKNGEYYEKKYEDKWERSLPQEEEEDDW